MNLNPNAFKILLCGENLVRLSVKGDFSNTYANLYNIVAEQIYEKATRKIPQIV